MTWLCSIKYICWPFTRLISSIEAVKHIAEGLPAASSSTMHVHTNVVAVCFSVGCSDWQLTARCQAGPPPSSLTTNLGECAKPAGRERNNLTGLRYPLIQHIIYIIYTLYPRKEWPLSRWHDCAASSISAGLSLDWSAQLKQWSTLQRDYQQHPAAPCMCTPMLLQCVFLLDALIDSSPQDVRQGRHPAAWQLILENVLNQPAGKRNSLTGLRYPLIQHVIYIIYTLYPRKEWPLSRWHDCAASSISAGLSLDWSAQLKQWSTLQRDYQQHPAAPCMCTPMLLQCVFLLDALIDSSPQDVRQGRHPAAWQLILENVLNQLAGKRNSLTGLRYPLIQHIIYYIYTLYPRKEWPLSRWHDCAASSISAGLSLDWSAQLKQWSTLQRDYQQHPAAPCMCTPMLLQCVFCWMLWLTAHRKMSGRAATQQPDN